MSEPTGLVRPVQPIVGIPWVSGVRYDGTSFFGGSISTSAISANMLYAYPMLAIHQSGRYGVPITLDRIGIDVTTPATAGKVARLGLARMGIDGLPGEIIVDAGEVAVDADAAVEATISAVVYSGVPFWRLLVSDGTPTLRSETTIGGRVGMNAARDTSPRPSYQSALTYTAGVTTLPDPFPSSPTQSGNAIRVFVRSA